MIVDAVKEKVCKLLNQDNSGHGMEHIQLLS